MGVAGVVLSVFLGHLICSQSGYTQAQCTSDWFGALCQYKCRCNNYQCKFDGNCMSRSKCLQGWFGPACQYYNLARIGRSSYGSSVVTDGDDATCNHYEDFKSMTVSWSVIYHFSWLRLVVDQQESGVFDQITVIINNNGIETTCADLTRVDLDSRTQDIHCPNSVLMSEIQLTGLGVKSLCSLYISGGRNVAIKQNTSQSSTYSSWTYSQRYSQSGNAVDGNVSPRFEDYSCSHTETEQNPTWNLYLSELKLVNRYLVYNRDYNPAGLNGFILESYDGKKHLVLEHPDNGASKPSYQIIDTKTDQRVLSVLIYLNRNGFLALCEVELYGDSICPRGQYGRDCELRCNCDAISDSCFISTGGCPSGCPAGFYGEGCRTVPACRPGHYGASCDRPCPLQCQGQTCTKESGFCSGCEPGWRGLTCDKACGYGRFGKGCTEICSYQCAKVECDAADGTCVDGCREGYKPPLCYDECDSGFYGRNCTQPCSRNCNGTCEKQNGTCLHGCIPGYEGALCDKECKVGFYGAGCQKQCSPSCLNSECNHVTGVCKECPPGKRGDQCEDNCDVGTYGKMCANKCSENCQGNEGCDSQSGHCKSGCKIGHQGAMCDKPCENMTYGEGCKFNCSQFCAVDVNQGLSVCHHVSGECRVGCIGDYEGDRCVNLKLTDSGVQSGAIAGPIVVLLLLVVILIIGMFVWRRRKRTKYNDGMINGSGAATGFSGLQRDSISSTGPALVLDKAPSYPNVSELTPNDKNNQIYYNTASEPHKTGIAVDDLSTFMLSHSREYFAEQFKTIPISCNASMSVGMSAENKNKNRYKNICAYDHSRVLLIADSSKGHGDYINASYIQGYNKKETFIASQGPSKVIIEDFVRLLWEQKSDIVVMLTNLVEDGKQKCEQYWPDAGDLQLGEIKLKLLSSQVYFDCVIRKLQLRKDSQATHTVTQFHFTSWPDKSVPSTPWGLVDFQQRVFSHPTSKAIVIHCSAGVGRTGTFIALRNVIKEAEDTGYMDFYATLSKLRQDRINMIQTVEQFIFLHEAAQVAIVCLGTTTTPGDVRQKIDFLEETTASGQTNIDKEFKAVCDLCTSNSAASDEEGSGGSSNSTYMNSRTLVNKVKNRFSNVLPKDYYRPHLFCETKDMGEYINAVLLPSLTAQRSRILTQLPLPATVIDYWRMVTQYSVSLIVAFELDTDDVTVGAYIPSGSGVPLQCGPFEVKITAEQAGELWEEKVLLLVRQKKRKPSLSTSSIRTQEHQVTHLKCTKCDFDPSNLLTFIQKTRSYKTQDKSRILFMCRNGALYSGLACVLTLLLDGINMDSQVSVPLAVGSVKTIRPQVVPTLDQYRTLYQVLNLYCDSNNTYSNCADVPPIKESAVDVGVANVAFEGEDTSENVYANF